MNFERIEELAQDYPVQSICKVWGVSRSAFYEHRQRKTMAKESLRKKKDREISARLEVAFREHREVYGRPRLWALLRRQGIFVSQKRVARLMRELGIAAKRRRRFRKTTDSAHDDPIAPNRLERDFSARGPNEKWVSDITYIRTWRGWVYLCVVMDLFSRKIVGWSVATHMETSMVLEALNMAIGRRRPPQGLIFHSDRGSQYASKAFRTQLKAHGILQSMSRAGDCWDNSAVESFNDKIKQELVFRTVFKTQQDVILPVMQYIECFYNTYRLHSALGQRSPVEYEEQILGRQEEMF